MPLVSVSTTRGASNAGPTASTVTPGSTAPEVSLTVPVIDACAIASRGTRHSQTSSASLLPRALITVLLQWPEIQILTTKQLVEERPSAVKDKFRKNGRIRRETTKPDREGRVRMRRARRLSGRRLAELRRVNRHVRFDVAQLRRIPAV